MPAIDCCLLLLFLLLLLLLLFLFTLFRLRLSGGKKLKAATKYWITNWLRSRFPSFFGDCKNARIVFHFISLHFWPSAFGPVVIIEKRRKFAVRSFRGSVLQVRLIWSISLRCRSEAGQAQAWAWRLQQIFGLQLFLNEAKAPLSLNFEKHAKPKFQVQVLASH